MHAKLIVAVVVLVLGCGAGIAARPPQESPQELLRKAAAGNAKWRPALDTANYWVLLRQAGSAVDAGNAASASAAVANPPRLNFLSPRSGCSGSMGTQI